MKASIKFTGNKPTFFLKRDWTKGMSCNMKDLLPMFKSKGYEEVSLEFLDWFQSQHSKQLVDFTIEFVVDDSASGVTEVTATDVEVASTLDGAMNDLKSKKTRGRAKKVVDAAERAEDVKETSHGTFVSKTEAVPGIKPLNQGSVDMSRAGQPISGDSFKKVERDHTSSFTLDLSKDTGAATILAAEKNKNNKFIENISKPSSSVGMVSNETSNVNGDSSSVFVGAAESPEGAIAEKKGTKVFNPEKRNQHKTFAPSPQARVSHVSAESIAFAETAQDAALLVQHCTDAKVLKHAIKLSKNVGNMKLVGIIERKLTELPKF